MDINKKHVENAEEYANLVRAFVTLLDKQFTIWEECAKDSKDLHELARRMPALISLVNTIGYLRGQDGVFLDVRPGTENQEEFYGYEDAFEKRLQQLIDMLIDSDERKFYRLRLDSYFVKFRTGQKATI